MRCLYTSVALLKCLCCGLCALATLFKRIFGSKCFYVAATLFKSFGCGWLFLGGGGVEKIYKGKVTRKEEKEKDFLWK